jgi:hypothetical protein
VILHGELGWFLPGGATLQVFVCPTGLAACGHETEPNQSHFFTRQRDRRFQNFVAGLGVVHSSQDQEDLFKLSKMDIMLI